MDESIMIKRVTSLYGILYRYLTRLDKKASDRSDKLDRIIRSVSPDTQLWQLNSVRVLKRSLEKVSLYIKDRAIYSILSSYVNYYRREIDLETLPTPSRIIFFFQRQKDREDKLARDIATYFSTNYNTLAPMEIIERDRMDFSPIDFGGNQVELAKEIAALDYAFEYSDVNMLTIDDMNGCIRVANRVGNDVFTESGYERFCVLRDEYDIGGVLYRLPEQIDMLPLHKETKEEMIVRLLSGVEDEGNNNNPLNEDAIVVDNTPNEQSNVDFFPSIQDIFKDGERFDVLVNYLVRNNFIEDDPVVIATFKYRFLGTEKPKEKLSKIVWRINALRSTKSHPGELFGIIQLMSGYGKMYLNVPYISEFFSFAIFDQDKRVVEDYPYKLPIYTQRYVSKNDPVQNIIREMWNITE